MLKFSKVIAANSDLETSQAFVFSQNMALEDQPDFSADLYLAVLISGAGENIFTQVRQSAAELDDNFFESTEPISERLSSGLAFLREKLNFAEDLEILIAAWRIPSEESPGEHSANVLFIQNTGSQKIFLLRGDELVDLLASGGDGHLISGYLQSGDRLLFLNQALYQFFTREAGDNQLKKILREPVEDLEEEVNAAVLQIPKTPPLAAILVDYRSPLADMPEAVPLQMPVYGGKTKLPKLSMPKSSKSKIIIIAPLILLLILGGLFFLHKRSTAKQDAVFQTQLQSAQSDFDRAQNLASSDPDGAKQALIDAKGQLAAALKIKPKDSQALALGKQIDQNSNTILKINNVTDWPLFLDLNLIKSGFSTSRMSLSVGELLLLDTTQKSLVSISLDKKTNQVLGGTQQLGSVEEASINGSFAFAYSKDKGVVRIDTNSLKTSVASKPDSDWGDITDVVGFGGNFYLLDNLKNQIWKYTPTETGYSDKMAYLTSDTKADFSGAKRLLIDSSVWVLRSDDTIDRFTEGSPDNFSVGGLDQPIKSITTFFVSDETDNLYLIDPENSRLVILKKSGQYVAQLSGDKFKDASDLVVDEPNKKLYLLENNKIYQVSLP